MEDTQQRIRNLLSQDHWTAADAQWMADYLSQPNHQALEAVARELFDADIREARGTLDRKLSEAWLRSIHRHIEQAKPRKLRWLPYAAAVLLFALAGTWFFLDTTQRASDNGLATTDVAPGSNRATLALADGRTIDLSEAQTGIVIGDNVVYNDGSAVLANGQPATANGPANGKESQESSVSRLMSLTTPKGGTYQITLPDGTTVWLNAASTLKYPSRFTGDERVVELEGEAYFDVSERERAITGGRVSRVPFKVISNGQQVEVLGTQFNISAYLDEPEVRTTLVEGSVRVAPTTGPRPPVTLQPGQQSSVSEGEITVRKIDVRDYTSWKEGVIILNQTDLYAIIRQIERWYDVEFETNELPVGTKLNGILHRKANLSAILEVLSVNTGKTFYIKGRRVMIQ